MTEPEIRATRPGDGPACARLWRDLGEYFAGLWPGTSQVPSADGLAEWFEEINAELRADPGKRHMVAEADGEIVGTVLATLHEPMESGMRQVSSDLARRRLHIDSLGVASGLRRGGVGTALLEDAVAWGRARGAEIATLETQHDNPIAIPFYRRRMGFAVQDVVLRLPLAGG